MCDIVTNFPLPMNRNLIRLVGLHFDFPAELVVFSSTLVLITNCYVVVVLHS
jgi:hypothetical protein